MGKPTMCIGKNKNTDQLREADQRLCFRYTDSTIPLLSKSKIFSLYQSSVTTARFVSDLIGTPNCWFSRAQAHLILLIKYSLQLQLV